MTDLAVWFVAAGFDLDRFWRLTPRSFVLMMRGAREAARERSLSMALAVRAGSRLDNDTFEKWFAAASGRDRLLPPEALGGVLSAGSAYLEKITFAEALERMH